MQPRFGFCFMIQCEFLFLNKLVRPMYIYQFGVYLVPVSHYFIRCLLFLCRFFKNSLKTWYLSFLKMWRASIFVLVGVFLTCLILSSKNFYWNIADIEHCISFKCTTWWFGICIYCEMKAQFLMAEHCYTGSGYSRPPPLPRWPHCSQNNPQTHIMPLPA